MLTVSMPTYHTPPDLLDRAVGSVLDALPDGGNLIVVNDGGQEPSLWDDRRLTVWNLPRNRGRYHCDALVLATLEQDRWWSPHDADDWSEPHRYDRSISKGKETGMVVGPMWRHEPMEKGRVQQPHLKNIGAPVPKHIAHWCSGVYRVWRVWEAGGMLTSVRTEWDHGLVASMAWHGPMTVDKVPTYHWVRRRGSLTSGSSTAVGTAARHEDRRKVRHVYAEILSGRPAWEAVSEASGATLNDVLTDLETLGV